MMLIRIILLIGALLVFGWFIAQRTTTRGQAWAKLAGLVLFGLAVTAIILPELTNDLASSLGVGRGADLLLYLLALLFFSSLVSQYLYRQDEHRKLIKLARKVAILEANRNERNQKISNSK